MGAHKHSIIACARWESEDIVEWIEYHRLIGFDHFYIYSNDDEPTSLLKVLLPYIGGANPLVTYIYWKDIGQQSEMYAHYLGRYKTDTEWAMFLDIDEFLTLKTGSKIGALLKEFDHDVDCVYFNWVFYGNNGKPKRDGRSVLSTLNRRSASIDVHTKTIFRTKKITEALARQGAAKTGNAYTHFWNGYPFQDFKMRDVIHRDVADYADEWPRRAFEHISEPGASDAIMAIAYIAHFAIKSEEDFLRRVARGGFEAQSVWGERYRSGEYRSLLDAWNAVRDDHLKDIWDQAFGSSVIYGRPNGVAAALSSKSSANLSSEI